MGADSTLADQRYGVKYMSFGIKTPYPFIQKPTLESLGLGKKPFYTPAEVAKALGDHKDMLRKRILAGIYPDAQTKLGNGQRRFTPQEVLIMATIKEKIKAGIRVHI